MDKDTLTKKVLEVFSDILPDIDAGKLDMTAELTTEYGVNSVSIIQFIVGLEQAFNIEFDDSELALGLYYDMNDVVKAVAAKDFANKLSNDNILAVACHTFLDHRGRRESQELDIQQLYTVKMLQHRRDLHRR